jgi:FMN phosphatase YigB (HAD superfamily)
MSKRPELILFDIGSVIIDVDHLEIATRLAKSSEDPRYTDQAEVLSALKSVSAPLINDYDTGKISSESFYQQMVSTYQLTMDFDAFREAWNSCFRENVQVSALVNRLGQDYRLFLLSNTNAMHFECLQATFPVIRNVKTAILSYEVRSRKPERAIYEHALKLGDVPAESVWYVDDRIEFVNAATQLGIHAIQFQTASKLIEDFHPILNNA